jgi:hypothetical protein
LINQTAIQMTNPNSNNPDQEYYKTYLVKHYQDQRVNDIAWWERKDKKDVIQEALDMYLEAKKEVPKKSDKAA